MTDQGSGVVWQETVIANSQLTYTYTALTGGTQYKFKLKTYNKYGPSLESSELAVIAAQPPDQVSAPTIVIEQIYIKIGWIAPFENYAAIEGYRVMVIDGTDTYIDVTNQCNQ